MRGQTERVEPRNHLAALRTLPKPFLDTYTPFFYIYMPILDTCMPFLDTYKPRVEPRNHFAALRALPKQFLDTYMPFLDTYMPIWTYICHFWTRICHESNPEITCTFQTPETRAAIPLGTRGSREGPHTRGTSLGGVPREQKMLKGYLLRVVYHQVY